MSPELKDLWTDLRPFLDIAQLTLLVSNLILGLALLSYVTATRKRSNDDRMDEPKLRRLCELERYLLHGDPDNVRDFVLCRYGEPVKGDLFQGDCVAWYEPLTEAEKANWVNAVPEVPALILAGEVQVCDGVSGYPVEQSGDHYNISRCGMYWEIDEDDRPTSAA